MHEVDEACGKKSVETAVLTPALSSEEREKTSAAPLKMRTPGFAGRRPGNSNPKFFNQAFCGL
jgi:hypothetical protein